MAKRTSKKFPSIYVDEHLPPDIATVFRSKFRTVEIAQTQRFKGRDEADYLGELYRENGIFVTSDFEFIKYVLDQWPNHAGIVYLPTEITRDEQISLSEGIVVVIEVACADSHFFFRNRILYPRNDGLHITGRESDKLAISWGNLFSDS